MQHDGRLLFCSLVAITIFGWGCKSVSPENGLQNDTTETGDVIIPVLAGPGKIKVTAEEADFIKNISASGSAFRNPDFWEFFEHHRDLAQKLLETKWFTSLPNQRDAILKAADALGVHGILFLDLGIAIRAEAFRIFALTTIASNPNIKPFDLRQAFAASLPKAVVYRGILLTPAEAEIVKREGIKASGFYQSQNRQNTFLATEYLLLNTFSSSPSSVYDDLNRRLNGMTGDSIFASYSQWIEVTYAGCWLPKLQGGGLLRSKPGIKFYMFKVEVSELDLIRPNGMLYPLIDDKVNQIYKTKGLDGQDWSKSFGDPAFEMFIQFVKPSEIMDVVEYDEMPPKWST